jgi:hypothetical protein
MVFDEASKVQGEKVEELRVEWKRLWRERFDDKLRAEGIANQDYSLLSVERGTVIFATRSFRLLSFKGILEEHGVGDLFRFVSPSPGEGGWRKFINGTAGVKRSGRRRAARCYVEEKKKPQQLKKGGRGWLHV